MLNKSLEEIKELCNKKEIIYGMIFTKDGFEAITKCTNADEHMLAAMSATLINAAETINQVLNIDKIKKIKIETNEHYVYFVDLNKDLVAMIAIKKILRADDYINSLIKKIKEAFK